MQEYAKKMYKQFFDSFNIVVKTFVSSAPEAGPEGAKGARAPAATKPGGGIGGSAPQLNDFARP